MGVVFLNKIDESNWFSKNRIFFFAMKTMRGGYIDGNYRAKPKGLITATTQDGIRLNAGTDLAIEGDAIAMNRTSKTTKFESNSGIDSMATMAGMTFAVKVRARTHVAQGSQNNTILGFGSSRVLQIAMLADETLRITLDTNTDTDFAALSFADNEFHTIILAIGSSVATVYWDGIPQTTTVPLNTPTPATDDIITIGGDETTTRYIDADIEYAAVFDTTFNDGQALEFTMNPYQIFKPRPQFALVAPQHELIEAPQKIGTKQAISGINWENSICKNLTTAIPFTADKKLHSISTTLNNMSLGTGEVNFKHGFMSVDDAAEVRVDLPPSALGVGSTLNHDYTVFIIADAQKNSSTSGTDQMLVVVNLSGTTDHVLYFDDTGTNGRLSAFSLSGFVKPQSITEPNFTPGIVETYGTTYVQSTGVATVFLNGGSLIGGDQGSATMSFAETISATGLNCFALRSNAVQFKGEVYLFLTWDRALSAEEYASIHKDPYQVFKYPSKQVLKDIVGPPIAIVEKPW